MFTRTEPSGTGRRLLPDALGSTVAIMNSTGTPPAQTYTYEPFGRTMVSPGTITNPMQYTGRESDGTGPYYYRARYYHPGLQRFLSEDPIGFGGGDVNLYAYVANRPTRFRDSLGLNLPKYHRRLVMEAAEECGFSATDAVIIAEANTRVDTHHPESWLSNTNPWHAMPGTNYQPIILGQLEKAISEPAWNRALQELGKGSHPLQDQWAHDRNELGGDMEAHGREWFEGHPDNPASNPANWQRARQDTRQYFRDFMRGRGLKPRC